MRHTNLALIAALQLTPLQAGLSLNDQKILEVRVSKHTPTRLSVQDDIIQDLIVYPQLIAGHVVTDSLMHKAGHVFIIPEDLPQPFHLTIMTQKGKVQDLKIIPSVSGEAPIVLTQPVADHKARDADQHHRKKLEAAMSAALQGFLPPGFEKIPWPSTSEIQGEVEKTRVSAYRHKAYRLEVYTLDNRGDREISLSPSMFLGPSDVAVVFDQSSLAAGGQVRLAILHQDRPVSSPRPISLTNNRKG